MQVEVTQEDIDSGVPRSETCCALALAVSRQEGVENVIVLGHQTLAWGKFKDGRRFKAYIHANDTHQFVRDFDAGRPVKPGFYLMPRSPWYMRKKEAA